MSKQTEFEEFATTRAPHLYRAAWLLCGDPHRAEDLVQETLAKVYARWMRRLAGPIENPAAYAQTALVRTFISARRRRSDHERPTELVPERPDLREDIELRLSLQLALDGLAPLDRAVLVRRYLDDRSVAEVAATLGVSEGAVKNRSMRALERLRGLLGADLPDLLAN